MVDTQVIAMGVKLARQKNEHNLLKTEPATLQEFRPNNFDEDYQKKFDEANADDTDSDADSDSDGDAKKKRAAAVDSDDEWNNVTLDRKARRTQQRDADKVAHFEKRYGAKLRAKKEA